MCYILILVSTLNTYTKHLPNVFLVESVRLAHVSNLILLLLVLCQQESTLENKIKDKFKNTYTGKRKNI